MAVTASDGTPAGDARELTDTIYWRLRNRRPDVEKFEDYYNGEQKLNFATDEWKRANGSRYDNFSDNWCASIVNAIGERTRVIGLSLRDDDKGNSESFAKQQASALWDQWLINEMDSQSSAGFLTSFIAKRSYVLVWREPGQDDATITWEHPSNVEIQYDWMNPMKRDAALKTWVDEDTEYATLYTPEFLWKWERPRSIPPFLLLPQSLQAEERGYGTFGKWEPRKKLPKGEKWPLPNPMGEVPIVEVKNRPLLRGEPISEIAGVIPMQDAINLLWAYLFFAADYASMPARVLLGANPPLRQILDTVTGAVTGVEPITMKELNDSRFAVFSGENAKIAQWDAATLSVFTDVIEIAVGHIAAQTRTPATYLMANKGLSNVSAEGMETSETGLAQKEYEFQTFANPAIREIFRLVALTQENPALAREARMSTVAWKDAEHISEAQKSDMLVKKKSIGYPFRYLLELDGVSPYDQDRIIDMKADEDEAAMSFGAQGALNSVINGPDNALANDPTAPDVPAV